MQNFIILSAVCFVLCTSFRFRRNTQCTYSYQCTTTAPCCRDANGKTLTHEEDFGGLGLPLSGTCSSVIGKKGDICDSSCGCNLGLTCYRPVTGVCCLPRKCYDAAWVKQQEQYWANCHPPNCYYPV